MNNDSYRQFIAFTAIGMAVIVGGVYQFIVPRMNEIRTNHATIEQLEKDTGNSQQDQAVLDRINLLSQRSEVVRKTNEKAGDSGALYDLLQSLASETGIEFDRIQPADAKGSGKGPQISTYRMTWVGSFEQTVSFMHIVDTQIETFYRIADFQMTPVTGENDDQQLVSVQLGLSFYQYPIDEVLTPPDQNQIVSANGPTLTGGGN